MAEDGAISSPLRGDEEEELKKGSAESEGEIEDDVSQSFNGESDYEDAPSRLEESHISGEDADSHQNQNITAENEPTKSESYTSPTSVTNPRQVVSPGIGDETIYASASESFLSEAGDKHSEPKEVDSLSEGGSEDNDDTNDPLGLDEEDSVECADEKEEGEEEGEEGELDGDDDDNLNASAYQTEPVSSDDDLDGVQDNENQNISNSRVKANDASQPNFKTDSKKTVGRTIHNGHSKTENDINHEDHVELDYEEDLDDVDKLRGDGKLEDDDKEEAEDGAYTSGSDQEAGKNGDDEDDCEEGEIVDDDDFRQEPRRLCRFFSRGHCTWGVDCRFLHPGVNDKGNYSLIEKPLGPPSMAGRLGPQPWHRPQDRPPEQEEEQEPEEEEEPPPPSPPREETAWERGLRHAKEMRKLAKKRKEQETNFEEKKMNLSLEDVENKENHRDPERVENRTPTRVYLKDPYYDNAYDSEEDYYREDTWQDGHYQNFEVRWTRGPDDYQGDEFRQQRGIKVEEFTEEQYDQERERLREKPHYRDRRSPPADYRFDRMRREEKRQDKYPDARYKDSSSQKKSSSKPDIIRRDMAPSKPTRGDEWHDPWQRTNKEVPKKRPVSGSRSRSRSRGRRRKRSISSASSYTSRSRSSSYSSRSSYSSSSSYTSRSSSRSSSSSRSRSPRQRRPPAGRGGPPGPTTPGPAAPGGPARRAPPMSSRGISASTKSGGHSNRSSGAKSVLNPVQKPVARVPEVARVPSVPNIGKDPPGKGPPVKGSPAKPPSAAVERKSQKLDAVRPSPGGAKQGNEGQRRPLQSKPGGAPPRLGSKPGPLDGRPIGESGARPPGPEDRSRKPGRGIPSRMKRQAPSSSSSRSRSYSSSSRSSSGSSRSSSSSSGSSSGSADSDNLYRGVGKPGRRNAPPSPLRRKVPVPADKLRKQTSQPNQDRSKVRTPNAGKGSPPDRRRMEIDKSRERDRRTAPPPKLSPTKPVQPRDRKESDSRVRSMVSSSSGLAPAKQMAKDPLKVSGQKQSIKLTLSNKDRPPDRGSSSNSSKKRSAPEHDAPPNKKVARSPSKDVRTSTKGPPPKNPDKTASRSRPDSTKSPPAAKKPTESQVKGVKPAAAPKGKKSMSSRREELLQQLKAVEDAIARKRAKMN